MKSNRLSAWLAKRPSLHWLREEVKLAPIEPILHPSRRRLWWLGLSICFGNALFAWVWSSWLRQQYESVPLRVMASSLGYCLMARPINQNPNSVLTQNVFVLVFWLELPVLFSWMYLCNSGNTVWLATVVAMVLIYYHVTDWRLATVGTITGVLSAWSLFVLSGPAVPPMPDGQLVVHAVVFIFAWSIALLLNLSSANVRRAQLSNTLTTIGIMAHELRTPLCTVALLGDAIQIELQRQSHVTRMPQLEKLALRLHTLVRNMNHQIDTQIANAKLLQLPRYIELISAEDIVNKSIQAYPFQSSRMRDCVRIKISCNFTFRSSARQFSKVLDNLIKNALYSLMAANSKFPFGSVLIQVRTVGNRGQILVTDDGMGIDAALLPHIFKPFFSSNQDVGHGLGLAFCERVVQSAGGSIHVKSRYALGATFTIELPREGLNKSTEHARDALR